MCLEIREKAEIGRYKGSPPHESPADFSAPAANTLAITRQISEYVRLIFTLLAPVCLHDASGNSLYDQ
jgi:hypothetical protein